MGDTIREVDYYHFEVPDKAGEGARILMGLKQENVNLLACCGFPLAGGTAQIDVVPEDREAFRTAAKKLGLKPGDPKKAFLIQGRDRVGAVAETLNKLADKKISIVATQALGTGSGNWAMILWVGAADVSRASQALRG